MKRQALGGLRADTGQVFQLIDIGAKTAQRLAFHI